MKEAPPADAVPAPKPHPPCAKRLWERWVGWLDMHLGGRGFGAVVAMCLVATGIGLAVVFIEPLLGRPRRQHYLVWNLFLAWVPLVFAVLSDRMLSKPGHSRFAVGSSAAAWLLFLPNSPYIFTDLVHLMGRSLPYYWPDMMKILLFALVGFSAGMVSLQMMHERVEERFGWRAGWSFVAVVLALCSVGVYLGRFRRWNSWDALNDAKSIVRDATSLMSSPWVSSTTGQFCVQLFLMSFCGYLILRGLRHSSAPR